jgi:hypothetical protein
LFGDFHSRLGQLLVVGLDIGLISLQDFALCSLQRDLGGGDLTLSALFQVLAFAANVGIRRGAFRSIRFFKSLFRRRSILDQMQQPIQPGPLPVEK